MKKIFWFFLLLAALATKAEQVLAQETPEMQLQFVGKLRARGYPDLAMDYLQRLQKTLPASYAAEISLELARTRLSMAKTKNADQRLGLYKAAQAELEDFVQKNPKRPEAMQAKLEIARLIGLQGQVMLNRALRQDDPAQAKDQATRAEQLFIEANKELAGVAKQLGNLAATLSDKVVREKYEQEQLQAQLDQAINMMDQARTYLDTSNNELNRKKAETIFAARKQFESVLGADKGPLSLVAAAWLVKCYQEGQEPLTAINYLKRVLTVTGPDAQPAHRLARMFYIQGILSDPTEKGTVQVKVKRVEDAASAWLKDYPNHLTTPEGIAVRFELGKVYLTEAQAVKDQKSDAAVKLYKQAQSHFADLADGDSDYAEKANQFNMSISFLRMGGEKTAIADLRDFDECYLRAQFEISKMRDVANQLGSAPPKDAEKLEEKRKQHMRDVVQALMRAIALADTKTSVNKVEDAKYFLTSAYLMSGDLYRAAVAGEALGRAQPISKRSSAGAGYAIEAYAALYARDASDSNRTRLRGLTDFVLGADMQRLWQSEPVTSVARYQLAMMFNREDKHKECLDQFEKLPEDFSGYIYAQGQATFIALQAREKAQDPKEKAYYQSAAQKAIARMGKLPGGIDPSSATMYFHAKMEQPKFLYAEGIGLMQTGKTKEASAKFTEMDTFLTNLEQEFSKSPVKLTQETTGKLEFALGVLGKYAKLGLADAELRAGQYEKVLAKDLVGGVVEAMIKRGGKGNEPIRMKDYQVTGELLALALRANVQKGNIKEAQSILKLLERVTGEEGALVDSAGMLRSLVQELQIQVRDLKRSGDKAKLKTTIANFSAFVDELAKQFEKKGLDVGDVAFLANFYASLDQQGKAATLYQKIPPPKCLDNAKLAEDEERQVQTYWYLQVQYARAMRLASADITDEATRKAKLSEARKVLDSLLAHKNARGALLAEKEQAHILEDSGLYGTAITRWGQFMNNPALKGKLGDDPKLKEAYFEAYYHHAFCWFKYSQEEKVKAAGKEKTFLKRAADYIVRLESSANQEGWQIIGHRFRELLEAEAVLKQEYDELKKAG